MLRTRLLTGAVLIALVVAMLVVDQPPWYPFLLLLVLVLALAGCAEMLHLVTPASRPVGWLAYGAVSLMVAANWVVHVCPWAEALEPNAWFWITSAFEAIVIAAFVVEMGIFREPGQSVTRIALTIGLAAYLGLLPSFFAQLRWLGPTATQTAAGHGTALLALAIFVPKCTDIGAYFTGRFLGRHPMAPVLSPKKTWEGAAGGFLAAVLATIVIDRLGPANPLRADALWEVGFGISVGGAGILGDLAESLIKRDCRQKDASHLVPGFGGVLDVVDAILFAAPVVYWWCLAADK
jgi:phosphatidate cytidylyltransferase